jgi:hypothetical protein
MKKLTEFVFYMFIWTPLVLLSAISSIMPLFMIDFKDDKICNLGPIFYNTDRPKSNVFNFYEYSFIFITIIYVLKIFTRMCWGMHPILVDRREETVYSIIIESLLFIYSFIYTFIFFLEVATSEKCEESVIKFQAIIRMITHIGYPFIIYGLFRITTTSVDTVVPLAYYYNNEPQPQQEMEMEMEHFISEIPEIPENVV